MLYREIVQDLFLMDDDYFLAHCISSDAKMGAGIAVSFCQRFDLSGLQKQAKQTPLSVGSCIRIGKVFNLVTKSVYYTKPTYETLTRSLYNMKQLALKHEIQKIAMPMIGSGLDRLDWSKNRSIIQEMFSDTSIEIVVCKIK